MVSSPENSALFFTYEKTVILPIINIEIFLAHTLLHSTQSCTVCFKLSNVDALLFLSFFKIIA